MRRQSVLSSGLPVLWGRSWGCEESIVRRSRGIRLFLLEQEDFHLFSLFECLVKGVRVSRHTDQFPASTVKVQNNAFNRPTDEGTLLLSWVCRWLLLVIHKSAESSSVGRGYWRSSEKSFSTLPFGMWISSHHSPTCGVMPQFDAPGLYCFVKRLAYGVFSSSSKIVARAVGMLR